MIDAVVFDLDGVLLDSEQVWDRAKRDLATATGRPWPQAATRAMMGMSSPEWSRYLAEEVGVPRTPAQVNEDVLARVLAAYDRELPLLPGAREAVERIAAEWPLGLASSSNREVIDRVLERMGVAALFAATVSSEEVARGKPAPDVYLEACRRLGVAPQRAVAVEDSHSGIRSAAAAGLRVVAIPNPHFPPGEESLALAAVKLGDLAALTPDALRATITP
ncbi:MAG TPA: HAD family phosphatase [Solirubrobacteraceae bacterium]|nr:HAD family phosphatase [Solirubrobacteraceae bacterium]